MSSTRPARPNPEEELCKVADLLSSYDLENLWGTSCVLSGLSGLNREFPDYALLFPAINQQRVSMFCRAIIKSWSTASKSKAFTSSEFRRINDMLINATDFPQDFSGTTGQSKLLGFFAKLGNAQFRYQNVHFLHNFGKILLLYSVIPRECETCLREKYKSGFVCVPDEFEKCVGISVEIYLLLAMVIYTFYHERFERGLKLKKENLIKRLEHADYETRNKIKYDAICEIIDRAPPLIESLYFSHKQLVPAGQSLITKENSLKFLEVVSRKTVQIREFTKRSPAYEKGELSVRLHPLEMYPVVRMLDDRFIVPDLSQFIVSVMSRIRYALMDSVACDNINTLFGTIQEKYVGKVLEFSKRNYVVIPEIRYARGKSPVDGPDFVVIDTTSGCIILIESKAKLFSIDTRVDPANSSFDEDMRGAVDSLHKLENKLEDLYKGLPEYSQHQELIDSTRDKPPIFVALINEGPFFMQEIFHSRYKSDPSHPLYDKAFPICLMDLRLFDIALELVQEGKVGLYQIFQEYWEDGGDLNPLRNRAEHFRDRTPDGRQGIAVKYANDLLDKLFEHDDSATN